MGFEVGLKLAAASAVTAYSSTTCENCNESALLKRFSAYSWFAMNCDVVMPEALKIYYRCNKLSLLAETLASA